MKAFKIEMTRYGKTVSIEKNDNALTMDEIREILEMVLTLTGLDESEVRQILKHDESAPSLTQGEVIEDILYNADKYGLRIEVEDKAISLLKQKPMMNKIEAYLEAYNDWIK